MKKFLLFTLSMALCVAAFCSPVDAGKARQVAINFWNQNVQTIHQDGLTLHRINEPNFVDVSDQLGFTEIYVFNCGDNTGFVIVAGDDIATPILGYSGENGMLREGRTLPENISSWLGHYEGEIIAARAAGLEADAETRQAWDNLLNNITPKAKGPAPKAVSALISTKWDQDTPYNNLCPYENGNRSMVGCVATAMAQVMKYWAWPTQGTGSKTYYCQNLSQNVSANFGTTTYDWTNMPLGPYPYSGSGWNSTQKTAVATISFHAGVSVEMEYGSDGSGAYQQDVPNALRNNFGYAAGMADRYKDGQGMTDTRWKQILKDELDAGRPIIYGGADQSGQSGHCFICDGYNGDQFHFNWGWSGAADGNFSLSSLTTQPGGIGGGSYNFTYYQEAITGISSPNGNPDTSAVSNDGLTMISDFTTNATQYNYGAAIRTTGQVQNNGSTTFSGQIGAIFYNSSNTIAKKAAYNVNNLPSGYYVDMTDTIAGGNPLVSGTYTVKMMYSTDNGSTWTIVAPDVFTNSKNITIVPTGEDETANYSLGLYQTFTIPSSVAMNSTLSGSLKIANAGEGTFSGMLGVAAYNSSNSLVGMLAQVSTDLDPNYATNITINKAINAPFTEGTYTAKPVYSTDNGSTWTPITQSFTSGVPTSRTFTVTAAGTTYYTITVNANPTNGGTVTGGGSYQAGATANLRATPKSGFRFLRWQDGNTQTSRNITVSGNATYTAYFQSTSGIDDIADLEAIVSTQNRNIIISGVQGLNVKVFDIMGRVIADQKADNEQISIAVPTHGVYVVKVENANGQKILVQ